MALLASPPPFPSSASPSSPPVPGSFSQQGEQRGKGPCEWGWQVCIPLPGTRVSVLLLPPGSSLPARAHLAECWGAGACTAGARGQTSLGGAASGPAARPAAWRPGAGGPVLFLPRGPASRSVSFGMCLPLPYSPWVLSSCPSNHLPLFSYIRITHFPEWVPHLALNSWDPTGKWGLGGYIEDRLGYPGGGSVLGEEQNIGLHTHL